MISDPLGRNDFIEGIKNYNQKFYRDVLTGVYNRRYYDEYAKNMTQMNALALIDGDNFGIINENCNLSYRENDRKLYPLFRCVDSL